jgi:hypothetical protein
MFGLAQGIGFGVFGANAQPQANKGFVTIQPVSEPNTETFTWSIRERFNVRVLTTENNIIFNIQNVEDGDYGTISIYNETSPSAGFAWGSDWLFAEGEAPLLNTGAEHLISFVYRNGKFYASAGLNYANP